jgi:hypothetical protein
MIEHITAHEEPGSGVLTLSCARCAKTMGLPLPVSIDDVKRASREWIAAHRGCKHKR